MKEVEIKLTIGQIEGTHKAYMLRDSWDNSEFYIGWFNDGSGVFISDTYENVTSFEVNDVDKLIERLRYAKERARATLEGNE